MGSEPGMPVLWRGWLLHLKLPGKSPRPQVERGALGGIIPIESSTCSRTCLPVTLNWTGGTKKTSALLQSWGEFFGCWSCRSLGDPPGGGFMSTSGQLSQWLANWAYHQGYRPSLSSHLWQPSRDYIATHDWHSALAYYPRPSLDGHS